MKLFGTLLAVGFASSVVNDHAPGGLDNTDGIMADEERKKVFCNFFWVRPKTADFFFVALYNDRQYLFFLCFFRLPN